MEQIQRTVFVGPSLFGVDVEVFPGEEFLGPAKAGDILKVARREGRLPRQIVLLDGVFYQDLSVWHKELVYALIKGIVCIGAASMGALRAAELWRYGMIGVGEIFERYRAGEEDDSLVALQFDPVTYRPLRDAPIGGQLKRWDALAALKFARSYSKGVNTTLKESDFGEYLEAVLARLV